MNQGEGNEQTGEEEGENKKERMKLKVLKTRQDKGDSGIQRSQLKREQLLNYLELCNKQTQSYGLKLQQ